jgi:hypothetical protein
MVKVLRGAWFLRLLPLTRLMRGWRGTRTFVSSAIMCIGALNLQVRRMEMSNEIGSRIRYGEAFWRKHHAVWQQNALNQREYCEAHGIPRKVFGNWRAKFKASSLA